MALIPCRHLDYDEETYSEAATLRDGAKIGIPGFRYWERKSRFGIGKVQFCGRDRGRINDCFACYEHNAMPCYEPER